MKTSVLLHCVSFIKIQYSVLALNGNFLCHVLISVFDDSSVRFLM